MEACASAPAEPSEESLLTVHLRTGDMVDMTTPCSFTDKVFKDGGFGSILIVSTDEHPCAAGLVERYGEAKVREGRIEDHTELLDFCKMFRSRNLLFSHSTFP